MGMYVLAVSAAHVLELPPQIYQQCPGLALKQSFQPVPNILHVVGHLYLVEDRIGDHCLEYLAGRHLVCGSAWLE